MRDRETSVAKAARAYVAAAHALECEPDDERERDAEEMDKLSDDITYAWQALEIAVILADCRLPKRVRTVRRSVSDR